MPRTANVQVPIGKSGKTPVDVDLHKLIAHRLLIQASSGGGKSYFLRVLAEQLGPHIQVILIDPEGEFATLREKLDMVLVSPEGEVQPNPKNAAALGRRLVELGTPAVCDLYELDKKDRRSFVRHFLDALMAVPKRLYRPMVVAIDEAHDYCPERSHGDAESTAAVINLLSKGRKRGFAGILATQRLSKLHKDAAAECGNLAIGRTSPVDQKRAADLLGIPQAERRELARLNPGEWMAYGPAFVGGDVVRFQASRSETTHPKAGSGVTIEMPAPSAAIKRVAGELADLAKREDDDPITLDEAIARIVELRRELRSAKKDTGPIEDHLEELRAVTRERDEAVRRGDDLAARIETVRAAVASPDIPLATPDVKLVKLATGSPKSSKPSRSRARQSRPADTGVKLSKAERLILTALAQFDDGRSKRQLAVITGYAHNGGGFNNAISSLRTKGYIEGEQSSIRATEEGFDAVGDVDPLPSGAELVEYWKAHPRVGKAARLALDALVKAYPASLSREELGERAGYEPTGGGFGNALSTLRTLGLIEGRGEMRASDHFFEEAV